TETARDSVASALEQDQVESHLHPEGSFDLADHTVPTGREEIWRFTPLKRLRGLHEEAALGRDGLTVSVQAASGVEVEQVGADAAVRGSSGLVPTDRVSARAWHAVHEATVVRIPAEAVVPG